MHTRNLGSSDLVVPALGLGTWSVFDSEVDQTPLVGAALKVGVNLFDSSPMYGIAENRLAVALGTRRDEALIATKVSAVEREAGLAQIRHALALFGTVDLYQIHNIVSWRLHLPTLGKLKSEGLCRAIGASQGLLVSDDEFIEIMRTGLVDSIQIRFNPKRRDAEQRVLPLAAELGIGVIVMQPLRWGVLLAEPTPAELEKLGVADWGQAILKWILSDQRVTAVLTATANPDRILANAAVAEKPAFDPDRRRLVEQILDRGISKSTNYGNRTPAELVKTLGTFLTERRGASYCVPCLSREFRTRPKEIEAARTALTGPYVIEEAACLVCGTPASIVRSRTIMR
jgi:aryl-alcohol dehydrogenase-like predicted oxidoreductase